MKTHPVFERPQGAEFRFGGIVGERIEANVRNWLLCAPAAFRRSNPLRTAPAGRRR